MLRCTYPYLPSPISRIWELLDGAREYNGKLLTKAIDLLSSQWGICSEHKRENRNCVRSWPYPETIRANSMGLIPVPGGMIRYMLREEGAVNQRTETSMTDMEAFRLQELLHYIYRIEVLQRILLLCTPLIISKYLAI